MKKIERASASVPTFWRHLTNMARPRSRIKEEFIWREYEGYDDDLDYTQSPKMSLENAQALNQEAEKQARAKRPDRFETEDIGDPLIRPMNAGSDIIIPGMLIDRNV